MDRELRDLQRRARLSNDRNLRLEYLRVALRAGLLDPERVKVAAYFGDWASEQIFPQEIGTGFCAFLFYMAREFPEPGTMPAKLPARPAEDVADIWASDLVFEMNTCAYLIGALLLMHKHSFLNPDMPYYHAAEFLDIQQRLDDHYQSFSLAYNYQIPCPNRLDENQDILAVIYQGICQTINLCQLGNIIEAVGFARAAFRYMLEHLAGTGLGDQYVIEVNTILCELVARDMIRWLLFNDDVFSHR